jgi:predicted MPP superfamily phosphohydrolase
MASFLRVLLAFTMLAQIVPALAISNLARWAHLPSPWAFGLASFVYGTGLFVGRARSRMTDEPRSWVFRHLVDEVYFVHWCAALMASVASVLVVLASVVASFEASIIERITWVYVVALALSAYGILVRRRVFVTKRIDIAIEGLDASLDGYRVVHLSDLHIGALTPKSWGMRWVRAANRLGADLAVITGDMVTSGTAFHHDIAEVVASLRAKDGTVVSMGNHDYFGGDGEPLMSLLREAGVRVMRNEGFVLRDALYLAAIDDTWTRRQDLAEALRDRPDGMPTLLLSHDPDEFRAAAKRDVDLVLSGHTHGGQIALPFFLAKHVNLSKLSHHYHLGTYRRGKSTLFVHPGLGTTGPPLRLGVAPAIVEITLRASRSSCLRPEELRQG